jgi:hypothetical protein
MALRRVGVVLRVVVVAAATVAVGVAINQVLNGGVWNWFWLAGAGGLAVAAEAVNQRLARPYAPQPADYETAGSRDGSVTVRGGTISGVIATGDHSTITQTHKTVLPQPTPVNRVQAPEGLAHLPPITGLFVGRQAELAKVEDALTDAGPVVVAAVQGLGGIGKSTLTAQYAAGHAHDYRLVWWVTADTPTAIEADLAGLAVALQPEETAGLELETLAERALVWLATHQGWLLVLDNVTDPAHIAPLVGRVRSGRVLVTSRLAEGWHRFGARVLRLDVLTEPEAVDLLRRLAQPDESREWPGSTELVAELGCLPLAVEQAGAYLHQTRITPARYLELLGDNPAVMYERSARGADGERSIARIWRITLDTVADSSLAGQVLRIMAWWGPEAIPRALLDPLADPAEVTAALGDLAAYNMITLDEGAVTVHRLVQAIARTPDPDDPHRQAADIDHARDQATTLLNQASPTTTYEPVHWPAWRSLLPHINALADHTTPDTDTVTTSRLLDRTATFLVNQGALSRAITYLQRALAHDERVLGTDHPHALASRNNLAYAYEAAGDLDRAIPSYEGTLADRERVLGTDHPDTLISRNNLANAYRSAGDLDRAIPLYERTLADSERVLGKDHPATLTSRHNLASAYQAAGDLDRAIPLLERTLADSERVRGDDHPTTKTVRGNLEAARRRERP